MKLSQPMQDVYERLLARLVDGLSLHERIDKLIEEAYELIDAASSYEQNPTPEARAALFDEMADVRIVLDELSMILGIVDAQADFVLFKTTRELCRRHYGNPKWCASHPENFEAPAAEPVNAREAVSDAQESVLEVCAMGDDFTGRGFEQMDVGSMEDLACALDRAAEQIRTASDALEGTNDL